MNVLHPLCIISVSTRQGRHPRSTSSGSAPPAAGTVARLHPPMPSPALAAAAAVPCSCKLVIMGVIEGGTATGRLPSTKVFAVRYPAYPSSMYHAIENLGGADTIAKVGTSTSNKLELHLHPEDPFSHPAFGRCHPCNNLLLKISRKNNSDFQNHNVFNGQSNESDSLSNLAQSEKGAAASTSMSDTQTTENSGVLTPHCRHCC